MNVRLKEFALRKQMLALKAEAHRLEIERELGRIGSTVRGLASGMTLIRSLTAQPLLASAAGVVASRVGVGRFLKIAALGALVWFGYEIARSARSPQKQRNQ